jgi:uncharacterized protein YbaR (Trm112 family)
MAHGSSKRPNSGLAEKLKLVQALESGHLDLLECPECHNNSVTVRFTQPTAHEVRTWFLCTKCAFRMRAQNSDSPRFFSVDRVDEQLEAYDNDVLTKKKL